MGNTKKSLPSQKNNGNFPRPLERGVVPPYSTMPENEYSIRILMAVTLSVSKMLGSPDAMYLALTSAQKMAVSWGVPFEDYLEFIRVLEAYWKVNRDPLTFF